MLSVSCLNFMPLSCITSKIVENGRSEVGVALIGALKSAICCLVLRTLLYSVISVSVDWLLETFSLFVVIQFSNSCMYACCCQAAVSC